MSRKPLQTRHSVLRLEICFVAAMEGDEETRVSAVGPATTPRSHVQ